MSRFPALFLSHGSPSLSLESDAPAHKFQASLASKLLKISGKSSQPSAILVISAHWEEREVKITHWTKQSLVYDFYGFPDKLYKQKYDSPGSLGLSTKIQSVLQSQGIPCHLETKRGLDHGVWSPLKVIYPSADIPVIQLSLLASLSEKEHVRIGRALRGLFNSDNHIVDGIDVNNVLIMGSGGFTHNIGAFFQKNAARDQRILGFADWARKVVLETQGEERINQLSDWKKQEGAHDAHPREEHWIPIFVILGLSDNPAIELFDEYAGASLSMATYAFPL